MCFVSIYENRTIKPIEIVLRRGKRERMMEGELRYIISILVNITVFHCELLYGNKIIKSFPAFGFSGIESNFYPLW
jgi:hypothetical protein